MQLRYIETTIRKRKRQEFFSRYYCYFPCEKHEKHFEIKRANLHPPPLCSDSDRVNKTLQDGVSMHIPNSNQICQLL